MNLAEQRAERSKLVQEMRRINDAADKDKRAFTPDEQTTYTKLEADVDKLDTDIRAAEDQAARADRLKALEARAADHGQPASKPTPGDKGTRTDPRSTPEYREAFRTFLESGLFAAQQRADTLQVGLLTKGGYLQPPQEFVNELIKGVDNAVFVRQHARKFSLTASESLGAPTLDADLDDFDWTSELLTGAQGDLTVGKRELRPHPMAKRLKVSKTLSRVSGIPIDALVRERLGYKAGITMENAYLNGDGNQKPLGVFTASALGVPVAQDVSTGNTATEITADGIIEAKFAMKPQYWPGARWVFSRTGIKKLRKLKNGMGDYIWQPGIAGSPMPSTIEGIPYDVSEYCPATFTANLYVGALCYWPAYWIVDALDFTVQFLDQLYAESNQNGYIARMEGDGAPVLAEAFVRVKLGA
jgi:HK97 family phage major capsid protein